MIQLDGRSVYLGKWGTEESRLEYERVVAEWRARLRFLPEGYKTGQELTVDDLIAAYWQVSAAAVRRPEKR